MAAASNFGIALLAVLSSARQAAGASAVAGEQLQQTNTMMRNSEYTSRAVRNDKEVTHHVPAAMAGIDPSGRLTMESKAGAELAEDTMSLWAASHPALPKPYFWFWGYVTTPTQALLEDSDRHFTLTPPSSEPYHLASPNSRSYSQFGQDLTLEPILRQIKNGFFVEAGAKDGEETSNTLFYEKLGWTGLLVEPNPKYTRLYPAKHRKAYYFEGCLSPSSAEATLHFEDGAGGTGHLSNAGSFSVLAEPLQDLLQGVSKTVDFWSLDIEGSEAVVLRSTDFSKVEVGVLLVEMNKDGANNDGIKEVMAKEGFLDIGHTNDDHGSKLDHIFVNPKYFVARGFAVPSGASLPRQNQN